MISVNDALISMDQLSSVQQWFRRGRTDATVGSSDDRNGSRLRDRDTGVSVEGEFILTEKLMLSNCFPIIKDDIVDLVADQDAKIR